MPNELGYKRPNHSINRTRWRAPVIATLGAAVLDSIEKTIEAKAPDVRFAHLKQITHSANDRSYVIHICHLPLTKQYRSYVFCGGSFVAWVLDPELDHSVAPSSPAGMVIVEKLIADTVFEIEENKLGLYAGDIDDA